MGAKIPTQSLSRQLEDSDSDFCNDALCVTSADSPVSRDSGTAAPVQAKSRLEVGAKGQKLQGNSSRATSFKTHRANLHAEGSKSATTRAPESTLASQDQDSDAGHLLFDGKHDQKSPSPNPQPPRRTAAAQSWSCGENKQINKFKICEARSQAGSARLFLNFRLVSLKVSVLPGLLK